MTNFFLTHSIHTAGGSYGSRSVCQLSGLHARMCVSWCTDAASRHWRTVRGKFPYFVCSSPDVHISWDNSGLSAAIYGTRRIFPVCVLQPAAGSYLEPHESNPYIYPTLRAICLAHLDFISVVFGQTLPIFRDSEVTVFSLYLTACLIRLRALLLTEFDETWYEYHAIWWNISIFVVFICGHFMVLPPFNARQWNFEWLLIFYII
jgi:hypothetical protein